MYLLQVMLFGEYHNASLPFIVIQIQFGPLDLISLQPVCTYWHGDMKLKFVLST